MYILLRTTIVIQSLLLFVASIFLISHIRPIELVKATGSTTYTEDWNATNAVYIDGGSGKYTYGFPAAGARATQPMQLQALMAVTQWQVAGTINTSTPQTYSETWKASDAVWVGGSGYPDVLWKRGLPPAGTVMNYNYALGVTITQWSLTGTVNFPNGVQTYNETWTASGGYTTTNASGADDKYVSGIPANGASFTSYGPSTVVVNKWTITGSVN